jgi:uncharacterized membrane protein
MKINLGFMITILIYAVISSTGLCITKNRLNNLQGVDIKSAITLVSDKLFLVGFSLYLVGFLYWFMILQKYNLSLAFPAAASSLIVLTILLSHFFLGESFSIYSWLGVSFIITGILFIGLR